MVSRTLLNVTFICTLPTWLTHTFYLCCDWPESSAKTPGKENGLVCPITTEIMIRDMGYFFKSTVIQLVNKIIALM